MTSDDHTLLAIILTFIVIPGVVIPWLIGIIGMIQAAKEIRNEKTRR